MDRRVGLCSKCAHVRVIRSARGSEFYLCQRADSDARFAKYPRLPVLQCSGYEAQAEQREREPPQGKR